MSFEESPSEDKNACTVPPEGWWCSRGKGHAPPCAARETTSATEVDRGQCSRCEGSGLHEADRPPCRGGCNGTGRITERTHSRRPSDATAWPDGTPCDVWLLVSPQNIYAYRTEAEAKAGALHPSFFAVGPYNPGPVTDYAPGTVRLDEREKIVARLREMACRGRDLATRHEWSDQDRFLLACATSIWEEARDQWEARGRLPDSPAADYPISSEAHRVIVRNGLYTSEDFACPYCGKAIYIANTGGGKSKHRHLIVSHVHNDSAACTNTTQKRGDGT